MSINTNIIKTIGICFALCAFIALQYELTIAPNSCQGQCQELALKDDIIACSINCKEEALPIKKLLLVSFIVLFGFMIGTHVLDGIFISQDPKYLNYIDNLYLMIKKKLKMRDRFNSALEEESSLYIPLFDN